MEAKVQVLVNKGGLVSAICTSVAELLKDQCRKEEIELINDICVSTYAMTGEHFIADPDDEETKSADSLAHVAVYSDGALLVDYEKRTGKGISLKMMRKICKEALQLEKSKLIEEAMAADEEAFRIIFQSS